MRLGEFNESTPVVISAESGAVELSVREVLRWIQPDAPPQEAFKFLMVCRSHGVNPFLGEAHLVPMGGNWSTVVDKSGWLRKAEEHPQFDGIEAGIVVQPHDPKTGARGEVRDVNGALLPPGHILLGGWCKVFRKDRSRPSEARVGVLEYKRPGGNWDKMTSTMIRKVAVVQALRESGLVSGGAYDASEMPAFQPPPPEAYRGVPAEDSAAIEAEVIEPVADEGLVNKLVSMKLALGITDPQWRQILARRGAETTPDLTDRQAVALIDKLQAVFDERNAGEILLPDPPTEPAASTASPPVGRLPAPEESIEPGDDGAKVRDEG
jgi:phage recombination protein Bet